MNKVVLLGNFTAKPELRYTQNKKSVATFSLAVQRDFKNQDGDYEADFINCYAFGKTGEVIAEHFDKGNKILVSGSIRVNSYETDKGDRRYSVKVAVDSFNFVQNSNKKDTKKVEIPEPEENDPFAEYGEQIAIEETGLPDDFLD